MGGTMQSISRKVAMLAGTALLMLAGLGISASVSPASAFVCDNSLGGEGGASDNGNAFGSVACGNNAQANSGGGGNNSTAVGTESTAVSHATAVGNNSDATGSESTAIGYFANAAETGAIAVGGGNGAAQSAQATRQYSIAIGAGDPAAGLGGANATNVNAISIGRGSEASGVSSTSLGFDAHASHTNSTAIGTGVRTTDVNQVALGAADASLYAPGIASGQSRSRQSGPIEIVTSDQGGHIATDGGEVFDRLGETEEGVAIALAVENPDLTGDERFGLALNGGFFEGSGAFGGTMMGVLWKGERTRFAVSGGVGVGIDEGTAGGRVGGQLTW